MKVLILVTSSNVRKEIKVNTYNEQEFGLAVSLSRMGIECGIAYYGKHKESVSTIEYRGCVLTIYLFKGFDMLRTAFFKNYDQIYEQYDILMPISYDHFETYRIVQKYPDKTLVYHGTYFASFNKRYNFKCRIFDKFLIPSYKKNNTLFLTKSKLATDFLNEKGLINTKTVGVGFDAEQMQSSALYESELSKKIQDMKRTGNKILLYIGRLEPRRNILFLIELFREVSKIENIKLVIIGNGATKYKDKCKELILQYRLTNKITYQERLEQKYLPLIYKLADLFLLPTSYEIFGMVLLEAMYFGCPVLTTYNGGSDTLIKNEQLGFIMPEINVYEWVLKIKEILEQDNTEMTRYAHDTIARDFTWDVLALNFIEEFEKIVSRKE